MRSNQLKLVIAGFGIYLLTTGASFVLFSRAQENSTVVSPLVEEEQVSDQGNTSYLFKGPRDQECPINGVMYTKEQREIWEKRRPLLVMIENHLDARPQSGLSRADVVYEAVAEGGITRFLGVFYCAATEPAPRKYDLGPVRSARTYFLDWASEYADYPLYVHVGGAGRCVDTTVDPRAKALCQIEQYGWKTRDHWNDMDQFALSYRVCRREPERTGKTVATEHTMYCDSGALWQEAEKRGLTAQDKQGNTWDEDFRPWKFKDDAPKENRGQVSPIEFNFWRGYQDYTVRWEYDPEMNRYLRFNGGQPHQDLLTSKQLAAKAVVIQFAREIGPVDEHKHLLYQTTGKGKALVFQDGKVIKGFWQKKSRQSRTIFTDSRRKEVEFNRGLIWIEVLPAGNQVSYGSS